MKVKFSGTLLRFVDFRREVTIEEAASPHAALQQLGTQFPKLKPVLFTPDGDVRRVHRVFVSGEQVLGDEFNQPISASDDLEILTAIAGG